MVMGAFRDQTDADAAVNELEQRGYDSSDISVITKERENEASDAVSDTAQGAVSGATTGGVVGGLAGLLAGAGVIPAIAGLFIGGPVAAVLGATGIAATAISGAVTGATAGGLIGALTGLGVSKETAEAYDETVQSGGYVLAVPVKDSANENPRAILETHGASDVSEVELNR